MVVESPLLLGLQIGNFTINMVFLVLFIYRFVVLSSFASTERYKDYFPKLRIFFSLVYVVVNVALLVETVVFNQLSAIDMGLVVVGEGIDSFILFIQLLVLRLQLRKQQPYTRFHLAYFLYLCLFSAIRFVIFILYRTQEQDVLNIVLSAVLIVDSIAQFSYWVVKKQSLPQFQVHTHAEIDSLRNHSKLLQNVLDTERSFRKASEDAFPYIIPFVSVDNGRIKIILQIASPSQTDPNDTAFLAVPKTSIASPSKPYSLNRATRSQDSNRESSTQILSCSYYSSEEIKNLYVVCSRFPMQKSLDFHSAGLTLPEMARQLQQFLCELFRERRWYHPSVLKYLRIPLDRLKEYSQLLEKMSSGFSKESELDQTLGMRVVEDKNAIFFSVSIYKHLWVDDHYEFYLKVVDRHLQIPYYPIKRYSEFEDFHNALRQTIKTIGRDIQLPLLPKKHLFHWNEDQEINQRRAELERYMRLLVNDHIIFEFLPLKQLVYEFLGAEEEMGDWNGAEEESFYGEAQVIKGEVSKCLIGKDLVTYYEFKVFKRGIEVCFISKRFSQFQQLHRELERWMHNIQITYKAVALPERHYYKSESIRHEKLKNYLQAVVDIREVGKVYAVNNFFNIAGSAPDDISEIGYNSRQMERSQNQSHVMNEVIELAQTLQRSPQRFSQSSESSRRFSKIINNLGDTDFD